MSEAAVDVLSLYGMSTEEVGAPVGGGAFIRDTRSISDLSIHEFAELLGVESCAPGCPGTEAPGACAKDSRAMDAFKKLERGGVPASLLAEALRVVEAAWKLKPRLEKEWPRFFIPPGMSKGRVNKLPGRLDRVADEISRVNGATGYAPEVYLSHAGGDPKLLAARTMLRGQFVVLPCVLRAYANYLRVRSQRVGRFRQGRGRVAPLQSILEFKLVCLVSDLTKHRHWGAIADVLYPLVGEAGGTPNAASLRMAYRRDLDRYIARRSPGG